VPPGGGGDPVAPAAWDLCSSHRNASDGLNDAMACGEAMSLA
jgi:hypothetical protein